MDASGLEGGRPLAWATARGRHVVPAGRGVVGDQARRDQARARGCRLHATVTGKLGAAEVHRDRWGHRLQGKRLRVLPIGLASYNI